MSFQHPHKHNSKQPLPNAKSTYQNSSINKLREMSLNIRNSSKPNKTELNFEVEIELKRKKSALEARKSTY